jgi:iron complex outermembrane receptor protein
MDTKNAIIFKKISFSFLITGLLLLPSLGFSQKYQEKQEKKLKKDQKKITEEILVLAEDPKELPVSTVTKLGATQIEQIKPLDLSEAIRYAPGVAVSSGEKSVYTLKLRGMDAKRIALLIDGIPIYEPYYSTFDLKTIATGGIDSLQITKGPSSVLYGPNTLGGIVNVITKRPSGKPVLSINTSLGGKSTRSLGLQSGFQWNRFAFSGTLLYQDSDGFYFPDEKTGSRMERSSSEYQRTNLNAKLYYNPNDQTELLFNSSIYLSDYSMPPEINAYKPRYWRFKNWDRYSFNTGGYTALGQKSTLRFRAYYVEYNNTLDMFKDAEMTQRRFESTFDNAVYGLFGLTDIYINRENQLKISINYKGDEARTQGDVGESWDIFDQLTFSIGIEDHLRLFDDWKLVGGLSYDYLDKFLGSDNSRLNPLLGIKYSPIPELDMHFSCSKKSKFPSMRSMYSSSSGNPDLLSEAGTNWELGFTYKKDIFVTGAVFITTFKNMIDSVRLPEYGFQRRYFNIAKAYINGFEIQMQKSFPWLSATFNYTYLDHRNESDDRPLDALPAHNLNFNCQVFPHKQVRIGFMGLMASSSSWLDFYSQELLNIPAYFNLDSIISFQINRYELFAKATNIFNLYIYSEPGFPWRGRYFELGFKASLL